MKKLFYLIIVLLFFKSAHAIEVPYRVVKTPWNERLGNHRAVIKISKFNNAVKVQLNWRRHDADVADKRLIVTDANGREVTNILRETINRETAVFFFQPVANTLEYFVYYLPWEGKKEIGYYGGKYLSPETKPDTKWVAQFVAKKKQLPQASVLAFESRTAFDSFYPMEVIATQKEINNLVQKTRQSFLIFPESRINPIRMMDDLPAKWMSTPPDNLFKDDVKRNEYYAFQLGLYASKKALKNVKITYQGNAYPVTCFNAEGTNSRGKYFTKSINLANGKLQSLWFGVDVPKNAKTGLAAFKVFIKPENEPAQEITIKLNVTNQLLADRGDSEPWRHSRLRWLNSTLGINDEVIKPYTNLSLSGKNISSLTSTIALNDNGFPERIEVGKENILQSPLSFNIETADGLAQLKSSPLAFTKKNGGEMQWQSNASSSDFEVKNKASMQFDGYIKYSVTIKSLKAQSVKDINLSIPVKQAVAQCFMGMGLPGMKCPQDYTWKWKGPQDSFWIGDVNAGIFCEMRGATYSGPLLNLYHPAPPSSWYNNNLGGFTLATSANALVAKTFSGERQFSAGDSVMFEFSLLITPVKKVDPKGQFVNRYYHNGNVPEPSPSVLASGINLINVHHANPINPFINYPFLSVDSIKNFAARWHKKGVKTKIYYTIRELTNQTTELWALRSLGNEILAEGKGGGYTWLREHLVGNYNAQWFTPINNTDLNDASVLTSGESRWYNYYIEGLKWIFENTGIDGLYLDDVAYDREMLKRMRRVMDGVKPGCVLDLHSNTGFSKGPATQYTEFFPYIDKLWFGESFQYDSMLPENWLVEVSGIPFGLMGDMLHAGGNPWRGMVYGMTVRYPWFTEGVNCDPREIWKIWDRFGVEKAQMNGYWEKDKIVNTYDATVLASAYIRPDSILVSIASWNEKKIAVKLAIEWKKLGWQGDEIVEIPAIPNFQEAKTMKLSDAITLEPKKGYLIIIKRKK